MKEVFTAYVSEFGVYGQPSPRQTRHETCILANNSISLQLTKIPYHFTVSVMRAFVCFNHSGFVVSLLLLMFTSRF
ncbi:hypothetical protein B9Z19DRAFT_1087970 [Tuber borchii]|uniref:Uncharacterized protein n=1 Tax=Tuber borchii TaxID=42251 RepID=A0A2T6ZM83_TUBBO|nr:hypothetical protein B9Z19DRAFT_1087970 [Tuber borchii]